MVQKLLQIVVLVLKIIRNVKIGKKKSYQGLSFPRQIAWNGISIEGIRLLTFDRGGRGVFRWQLLFLWCCDLFSSKSIVSMSANGVHKFELLDLAFGLDFFRFGGKRHCGNG
jgi:hypothetical protein